MASELARLKVIIEAESSRLQSELDKTNKKLTKFGRDVNGISKRIKGSLKGAFTGIATALASIQFGSFTKASLDAADNIQKLSLRLGASTEALSQYQHVADLTGVSQRTLELGFQRMTRRISEAAKGTGEAKNALKELGVDVEALNKLAPDQQFEALADAIQKVGPQADKVRLAMKLFDAEGVALVQTMEGGSKAIRAMREDADRLGLTLSQNTADAAARANDALTNLNAIGRGLSITFLSYIAPAVETVANALTTTLSGAISKSENDLDSLREKLNRFRNDVEEFGALGVRGGAIGAAQRGGIIAGLEKQVLGQIEAGGGAEGLRTAIDRIDKEIADAQARVAEFQTKLAEIPENERKATLNFGRGDIETAFSGLNKRLKSATSDLARLTSERAKALEELEELELGFDPDPVSPSGGKSTGGGRQSSSRPPASIVPVVSKEAREAQAEFNRLVEDTRLLVQANLTPQEEFNAKVERLNELRAANVGGGIDNDTYARAIEQYGDELDIATGKVERFATLQRTLDNVDPSRPLRRQLEVLKELQVEFPKYSQELSKAMSDVQAKIDETTTGVAEATKKVGEEWNTLGETFSSAFEDAIIEGKSLKDVLSGLEQDLLRIVTRNLVTKPLEQSINGIFQSLGTGGGAGGGGFNIASLFSGIFGASRGADFTVGSQTSAAIPGVDNRILTMKVRDGERVTVSKPGESASSPTMITNNFSFTIPSDSERHRWSGEQVARQAARAMQGGF